MQHCGNGRCLGQELPEISSEPPSPACRQRAVTSLLGPFLFFRNYWLGNADLCCGPDQVSLLSPSLITFPVGVSGNEETRRIWEGR